MRSSRQTRQKEVLRSVLPTMHSFFTAEEFLAEAKKIDPEISIATIYRFLKRALSNIELYSYRCDRHTVYSVGKKSHCHFVCENTGKTIHFDVDNIDFLRNKIPGTITSFQIEVRGTCETCSNDKNSH